MRGEGMRATKLLDGNLILVREHQEEMERLLKVSHILPFQESLADHDNPIYRSHADLHAVVDQHPGDSRPEQATEKGKKAPLGSCELDDDVVD